MKHYVAKVKTRGGNVHVAEVIASDDAHAMSIASRGGRVLSLQRKRRWMWRSVLSPEDRQIFFTRLSAMLASRVGTSDALKLIRDTFGGQIKTVAGRLLNCVEGGDDLAGAFVKVGAPDFPETSVALIRAASRCGETWRSIKDAADLEYQLSSVRKGSSGGLLMAFGSFTFAAITIIVSTLYLGPKIMESSLMASLADQGSAVDIGWVNTSASIIGYLMSGLMSIALALWALSSIGRRVAPVLADELIQKIPYYKDLVLARNSYITLYGLALLVRSGVTTEEALRLTAQNARVGALQRDLTAALQAVRSGRPWASALKTFHATDRAALMSAVDREQIANTFDTLSRQYKDLYAQRLRSFVPLLNVLAALFLSLAGAILFGQSILPMLMASQNVL